MNLQGSYNAPVGKDECGLSWEETRRLALARLLLQDLQIFVLRKGIATLEKESETNLRDILRKLFRLRAVLVVKFVIFNLRSFSNEINANHRFIGYALTVCNDRKEGSFFSHPTCLLCAVTRLMVLTYHGLLNTEPWLEG